MSLPKGGVKNIDSLEFDIKFEQSLFRSKSKSDLTEILFDEKKFQTFIHVVPIQVVVIPSQIIQSGQTPPRVMVEIFAPLVLPATLHDLPPNYPQRMK